MTYDSVIRELMKFVKSEERKSGILAHKYGEGGLHYCCGAGIFHNVFCVDARSFYPHILTNWNLLPDWVNEEQYKTALKERMNGNTDEQLKMALNVPTGKLRMQTASDDDKERGLAMCLIGQVLITALQEMLEDAGYKTIQVNTDGIMVNQKWHPMAYRTSAFDEAIEEWTRLFDIPLTVRNIAHLEQKDVNNYKAVYPDGTITMKGAKYKR